ncbi:MAG: methyltransferase domain-containing protein [Acidimicrobiia bacterium]
MSSQDPYRNIAGIYDRLIEPMQAGVRRAVIGVLPPRPGWHVLDVGCGTGTGLVPYLDAGCTVAGVDVSEAMLEKAAGHLGDRADVRLTDGKTLPFADDRFDLVTTTMVLHEVPTDAGPASSQRWPALRNRTGRSFSSTSASARLGDGEDPPFGCYQG